VQQSADPPYTHAGWDPAPHAILAAQGGADGLQGDEEGEEEGEGGVEVVWGEACVSSEACG
jgi:hypothetical protein